MTSKTFTSGTVIDSDWLNDVNGATYNAAGGTAATVYRTAQQKFAESVSVKDFGAVGDGVTNDYAAIMAAINSLGNNGGTVVFPAGSYICNSTIEIYTQVLLIGSNSGQASHANFSATKITFPTNTNGIIVQRFNTTGLSGVLGTVKSTGGDGSVIKGIQLIGSGTSGNGITLRARAELIDCRVYSFGGHGIAVTAGSDSNPVLGNANSWKVQDCRVDSCLGSGLYVVGTDANAGYCIGLDASFCGTYGIYEASFLKNTYVACHTVGCGTANYYATNYSTFTGCYSESGVGGNPSTYGSAVFIGCMLGGGKNWTGNAVQISASSANVLGGAVEFNRPITIYGYNDTTKTYNFGVNNTAVTFNDSVNFPNGLFVSGDPNTGSQNWVTKYGNSSYVYYELNTGPSTTLQFRRSGTQPYSKFIPKLFVGDGLSNNVLSASGLAVASGTAIPTSGRWAVGDVVFNQNATPSGFVGWVCTTAGTMGTLVGTTGDITVGTTTLTVNTNTGLSYGHSGKLNTFSKVFLPIIIPSILFIKTA